MGVASERTRDRDFVSWTDRDGPKLREHLSGMLKCMVPDGDKITLPNFFAYDQHAYVVRSLLSIPDLTSAYQARRLIDRAATRLFRCKRRDLATFRRVLASIIRQQHSVSETSFFVVFPCNVARTALGRFSVLGVRLDYRPWVFISKRFDMKAWDQEVLTLGLRVSPFQNPFEPLVARVVAQTSDVAFDRAHDAFSLVRVAFNMAEQFGKVVLQSSPPNPLGRVVPPPVCAVFDDKGRFLGNFVEHQPLRLYMVRQVIDAAELKYVRSLLKRLTFRGRGTPVDQLIVDAVRRYGQALDTPDRATAFLILWQVLELLTYRSTERFDMDDVCKRVVTLFGGHNRIRDLMVALAHARNGLVHRGRFSDDGLTDVNMLKSIAEQMIQGVSGLRGQCRSLDELFTFYRFASFQPAELERTARIIGIVARSRRDRAKLRGA